MQSIYDSLSQDTTVVFDSLFAMIQKEQTTYRSCDYLLSSPACSSSGDTLITKTNRMQIVDWCFDIVDRLKLERETVMMAMEMVDRFLSKSSVSSTTNHFLYDRDQFQLLALTSLYITIKTNENMQASFGSVFFSSSSRGIYSVEEIENMERSSIREVLNK